MTPVDLRERAVQLVLQAQHRRRGAALVVAGAAPGFSVGLFIEPSNAELVLVAAAVFGLAAKLWR